MNVITEAQANEIIARQAAEAIDQGPIQPSKVIFEGKIMNRTEVAEIIDSRVATGHKAAFFDVQDAIEDNLQCNTARQRLRNNILFGMRYRIVSQARSMFYDMGAAAREVGHIDSFNEFMCELDMAKSAASYAHDLGYDEFGSSLNKLKAMVSVYEKWRTAAFADAENMGLTEFTVPQIRDAIAEPPMVDKEELAKALIVPRFELDEEFGEVAMKRIDNAVMLDMEMPVGANPDAFNAWADVVAIVRKSIDDRRAEKLKQAKVIAPYIERIIDEASRVPEDIEFYQLDLATQKALIESVLRSASKIPDQLTKDRRVSATDMALMCVQLRRLRTKLNDVLSDARFNI
jgi:hypothetical protein